MPVLVHEVLQTRGQPLDAATRVSMEARFGHDFGQVRVHTDAPAAASARAVQALAYTAGRDVVFDTGQYTPETRAGQRLLAHELTHVVQQTLGTGRPLSPSYDLAEEEADQNSQRITTGHTGQINSGQPFGAIQRQTKGPKVSGGTEIVRGVEAKPEAVKNKFSFDANLQLPLAPDLNLGAVSFLKDLKINLKGSTEGTEPADLTQPDISALQTQIALNIAQLETQKLTLPANLGELSLGAKLGASSTLKQTFEPEGSLTPTFGTTASLEAGFTPPALKLASRAGELSLGGKLSATGSLGQTFGAGGEFTPKLGTKAGVELGFTSPTFRGPGATLGGLLGEESKVTAGVEGSFATGLEPKSGLTSKLGAGVKLGVEGKAPGGRETFINLKVSGEVDVDRATGNIDATSQTFFFGITGGFKFGGK